MARNFELNADSIYLLTLRIKQCPRKVGAKKLIVLNDKINAKLNKARYLPTILGIFT
jgi:hypothetical protein